MLSALLDAHSAWYGGMASMLIEASLAVHSALAPVPHDAIAPAKSFMEELMPGLALVLGPFVWMAMSMPKAKVA